MKGYIKRITSLILAAVMAAGISVCSFADGTKKETISFDSDGNLKIMHVTDTHLEDYNVDASVWAIGEACDKEKPDIVIITGDNVENYNDAAQTKILIDKLMNAFEERDIPVAVTFGNHDSEKGAMSREELMAYYNTFSCSVSVDDGEALSGCGTYNIPVMSSDGETLKFNLWIFDSGDYDKDGHYGCVQPDQIEWYKSKSDELKKANSGEKVNSLVFQHIIVPEVYDALEKIDRKTLFSFEHMYNKGEYYRFDFRNINYGTLNETPCCGYENFGQFDAMVEKGDVLAMFTGHDHTNAFGVNHMGIDIMNSLSTRYNSDAFSTGYGYRMIYVNENDTSHYDSEVVRWYDLFDLGYALEEKSSGDSYGFETALEIAIKGGWQKFITVIFRGFSTLITGRRISYSHK